MRRNIDQNQTSDIISDQNFGLGGLRLSFGNKHPLLGYKSIPMLSGRSNPYQVFVFNLLMFIAHKLRLSILVISLRQIYLFRNIWSFVHRSLKHTHFYFKISTAVMCWKTQCLGWSDLTASCLQPSAVRCIRPPLVFGFLTQFDLNPFITIFPILDLLIM